jgi:hypothetical protein
MYLLSGREHVGGVWAENAATIMRRPAERTKNDNKKIEKNEGVPFEDLIKGDALHEFGLLCLYGALYFFFLLLLQLFYLLLLLLLLLALLPLFVVLLLSRPRRHSQ